MKKTRRAICTNKKMMKKLVHLINLRMIHIFKETKN